MDMNIGFADFAPRNREVLSNEDGELRFTFGSGSYLVGGRLTANGHVLIGNYCSMGEGIELKISRDHSMNYATTYPFDVITRAGVYRPYTESGAAHEMIGKTKRKQIVVGSDVWLGDHVTIMGGSKIGTGACIGTNALVSGEIPPYAVAVGVPARVIKYRFTPEIVKKLLAIKWWHWDVNKIHDNYELMKDVEAFCDKFYPEAVAKLNEESTIARDLEHLKASGVKVYYTYADFGRQNPTWENVLEQFIDKYDEKSMCALIFEVVNPENNFGGLDIIVNRLKTLGARAPQVFIHSNKTEQTDIMRNMDCFITTREPESILGVDYAWEHGAEIISGLDAGLFEERR